MREEEEEVEEGEAEIDRLHVDVLVHVFFMIPSFADLAWCAGNGSGVKLSLGRRERLSFAGLKMDDDSTDCVIRRAYALRELDILHPSLLGMTGVIDQGVVKLIARITALQHLNIGSTFITDESLYAIANSCSHLKVIGNSDYYSKRGLLELYREVQFLQKDNLIDPFSRFRPMKEFET
ncbi:hypothetical protein ACJRO7_026382 [Eucalyptus globulus]|uniref:Uncharacterized protein n=1 Tax=Eucalyptus globulus TaxID=34317 RepID=A0ABD3JQK5_EUCGL